jgi:hypothetical protein
VPQFARTHAWSMPLPSDSFKVFVKEAREERVGCSLQSKSVPPIGVDSRPFAVNRLIGCHGNALAEFREVRRLRA